MEIELGTEGELTGLELAGINLLGASERENKSEAQAEPQPPLQLAWDAIALNDLDVRASIVSARQPDPLGIELAVDQLNLSEFALHETGDLTYTLRGALLESDVAVQGQTNHDGRGTSNVELKSIDLSNWTPLLMLWVAELPVELVGELDLAMSIDIADQISLKDTTLGSAALEVVYPVAETPLRTEFRDLALSVPAVSVQDLSQPLQATLTTGIGRFGQLEAKLNGPLLAAQASGVVEVGMEQINLSSFNPLVSQSVGRSVERGALDMVFNGTVENGVLASEAQLELHQLQFGSGTTSAELQDQLGMPLNTALNLLRDRDDTIRMTLPIEGALNNPEVKVGSVVNKAVVNGLKTAVITQVGPLLALSALGKVSELSTSMRFKSIEFDAGADTWPASQEESLTRVADLLERRPKIVLNVCGIAGWVDLSEQSASENEALPDTLQTQLLALAQQRSENVKAHLMDAGIDGKRLILCAPSVGREEAAHVDFSL